MGFKATASRPDGIYADAQVRHSTTQVTRAENLEVGRLYVMKSSGGGQREVIFKIRAVHAPEDPGFMQVDLETRSGGWVPKKYSLADLGLAPYGRIPGRKASSLDGKWNTLFYVEPA